MIGWFWYRSFHSADRHTKQGPIDLRRYTFPTSLFTQVAGHPRNNLTLGSTYLTVELFDGGHWKVIATDANWETR